MAQLSVLLLDDRPESVGFIVQFLMQGGHQVESAVQGREALQAIARRRSAGRPYDLVIADLAVPEIDGLSLLRQLRQAGDRVPYLLVTAFASINPNLRSEAAALGALEVLDKPVDLNALQQCVAHVTAGGGLRPATAAHARGASAQQDQPFFGTGRLSRGRTAEPPPPPSAMAGGALEPRVRAHIDPRPLTAPELPPMRPPATQGYEASEAAGLYPATPAPPPTPPPAVIRSPMPGTGGHRRPRPPSEPFGTRQAPPRTPLTGTTPSPGYRRAPSAIFGAEDPMPPGSVPGTGVTRRITPRPGEGGLPPGVTTTRLRRGVSGTESIAAQPPAPPPMAAGSTRQVACAHCRQVFMVAVKAEAYNVVCVHCGGLNRIEP